MSKVQKRADVNENVVEFDDKAKGTVRHQITEKGLIKERQTKGSHCNDVVRNYFSTTRIETDARQGEERVVNEISYGHAKQLPGKERPSELP